MLEPRFHHGNDSRIVMASQQECALPQLISLRVTQLPVAPHLTVDAFRCVEIARDYFARLVINALTRRMAKTNEGRARMIEIPIEDFGRRYFQPHGVVQVEAGVVTRQETVRQDLSPLRGARGI